MSSKLQDDVGEYLLNYGVHTRQNKPLYQISEASHICSLLSCLIDTEQTNFNICPRRRKNYGLAWFIPNHCSHEEQQQSAKLRSAVAGLTAKIANTIAPGQADMLVNLAGLNTALCENPSPTTTSSGVRLLAITPDSWSLTSDEIIEKFGYIAHAIKESEWLKFADTPFTSRRETADESSDSDMDEKDLIAIKQAKHAGINLLTLLCISGEDPKTSNEAYKISEFIKLNALLGKKGAFKDLVDYWDVATYFELHVVQREWVKANQAALHMYLLNPPIWYMKSTFFNLKLLHDAIIVRDKQSKPQNKINDNMKSQPDSPQTTDTTSSSEATEESFSFWIEFFEDAVSSVQSTPNDLPSSIPILVCDNYEKKSGVLQTHVFLEAYLQLNFQTDPETLVIRILDKSNNGQAISEIPEAKNRIKVIDMQSIRSIINVKRDARSVFLYAYENAEPFSLLELQIYFSSVDRRMAFNEKMGKSPPETDDTETKQELHLEFEKDQYGNRISLGQGTYGRVFKAEDTDSLMKYAVKEISMRYPGYVDVLQNEIKILSSLKHRHIVSYYGTNIDRTKKPPCFQIIMEYVDGGSLTKLISKFGHFNEKTIRNYTHQILEGLMYLHENRILHRDIKGANMLVNSRGELKIADFGTSKRLAGLHLANEDSVGTLNYMSPDVVCVAPKGYGPEVDIWSVGCTVIEMATGKIPFHKVANSCVLMLKLGTEKQPPEIPSHLSNEAKDFLNKCFEQNPAKRSSAKELLKHPFVRYKGRTLNVGGT
ncbi:unnamed protein product, partial [Didymodactylos carnosus]